MDDKERQLIVKQDNLLINAAYTITLAEKRLILLAIAEAAGEPEALKSMVVHAKQYASRFNVTPSAAYMALNTAALQLFERRFSYKLLNEKGNLRQVHSRWVQKIEYVQDEGLVKLFFADDVIPLLCDLKNKYTYYGFEQIEKLTSLHALRLYELVIAWRSVGKTPIFELSDFREKLNIMPDEYPRMTDFKKWVLDAAIKQVDEHTDIDIEYHQHKKGRSISGFHFIIKPKKSSKKVKKDAEGMKPEITIEELSDKQRVMFAQKLAKEPSMGHLSKAGWLELDFSRWLSRELEKPENLIRWEKQLIKVGYVSNTKRNMKKTTEEKPILESQKPITDKKNNDKEVGAIALSDLLSSMKIRKD